MTFASQLSSAFTPIAAVYDSASVTRALSWAQSFVQGFCNQTFDLVTSDTVYLDPMPRRSAMLPQVPVVNVDSVLGLLPTQANTTPLLSQTPSGTGGTFVAGQYFWVVTAVVNGAESIASNEVTVNFSGSSSSNALSWTAVPFASGYRVYRGTASATETTLVASPSGTTFTDTGAVGSPGVPPYGLVWTLLSHYRWEPDTGLIYDTTHESGARWSVATPGPTWPWVRGGLQITYDHGYATIPQPLVDVGCRLAQQYLENPASIMQRRAGDVEYRYAGSKGVFVSEFDQMILGRYTYVGVA